MPRLYIDEYTRILAGRHVSIACREGILRDHFGSIVEDIKFLNRRGIVTILFHNMANRFANQKYFRTLAERLPGTRIVRVRPELDFYGTVLDQKPARKLIFLERKFLSDHKGRRINTLSPRSESDALHDHGRRISNANFRSALEKICVRIDKGDLDRVHILPARKHTLKHELFTVEGTGTLIANNFQESFLPVVSKQDEQLVAGILDLYKGTGFLKPRGRDYIASHRENFYMTQIDGIAVGCVEFIAMDEKTAELGALAISTRFRGQRVGVFTVRSFVEEARRRGYQRVISLTKNTRLQTLYRNIGFTRRSPREFADRQTRSPETPMFIKEGL